MPRTNRHFSLLGLRFLLFPFKAFPYFYVTRTITQILLECQDGKQNLYENELPALFLLIIRIGYE